MDEDVKKLINSLEISIVQLSEELVELRTEYISSMAVINRDRLDLWKFVSDLDKYRGLGE